MNKKSKINLILIFLGFVIFLLGIWYYFAALISFLTVAPPVSSLKTSISSSVPTGPSTANNPTKSSPPTPQQMRAASEAEANRERGIWNLAFMTPISFYGKVVDEKGHPIEGAKAVMSPADDIMGGNHEYQRTTDENGLFSLFTHGLGLTVDVSKEGYYPLPESSGNYGYASGSGMSSPHNNPKNPAIFILRKMGDTESLFFQKFHMVVAKDGTPLQLNLKTGSYFKRNNGDIQIEAWTNDANRTASRQFDWRARISVPGGNITPRLGEFDFIAPSDGWQNEDIIDMPATAKDWKTQISRDYFLRLGNGQYARVNVSFFMGDYQFINATSYLNPTSGHRNLEFDPAKQINK